MKKILLATTAVVALSTVSAEAFAADKIAMSVGGFMNQYAALVNNDEPSSAANSEVARTVNIAQWSNSEIFFRGNTTMDNGISVAADIQMETSTRTVGGRNFDVASLEFSSDAMGAVTIGSTTHSVDDFTTRAPNVGLDYGDQAANFNSYADSATGASTVISGGTFSAGKQLDDLGGKGLKLKYVSPNFSGVNVHISYAAATDNGGQIKQVTGAAAADSYSYGIAYSGEVSGASVSADLTHAKVSTAYDQNHFGINVGMAGFTVGGGITDFNDSRTTAAAVAAATGGNEDGRGYELGVAYETGPMAVSATYANVKSNGTTAATQDNEDTSWSVAGAYDLGAGVAVTGTYYSQKINGEDTGTAATVTTGKSITSKGLVAGIEVSF